MHKLLIRFQDKMHNKKLSPGDQYLHQFIPCGSQNHDAISALFQALKNLEQMKRILLTNKQIKTNIKIFKNH